MDDNNIIDITESQIARMKNLRPYRNKTDDEIREIIQKRQESKQLYGHRSKRDDPDYDTLFNKKLKSLTKEFGLDLNDANDAENMKVLVWQQIQLEKIDRNIDDIHRQEQISPDDYRTLKNLGDIQRATIMSINDVQEKLGISRKVRKEKQHDDIPVWISSVLKRADDFFDRKTIKIKSPKDDVELARIWLNFKDLKNNLEITLECWKCHEQIEWVQLSDTPSRRTTK